MNNTQVNSDKSILDNNYILDFFVESSKNITEEIIYIVKYLVYVADELYSAECQIELKIIPCYITCEICSKDYSESNFTQHNCIKCNNNYFFSPEKNGNCYSYKDKKINWYLDTNISEFALCNEKCKSCSGPTEYECTSCSKGLYLENGSCKDNCSEGYFKIELVEDDYFICEECYENCKTCSKRGNKTKMECEACKEEQIKYNNNCYNITNQTNKYFYDPESENSKSSCKQKFNLYIKEDSNECIENEEGYYISNVETGVLSKCHENCFSCSNGIKKDDQGNLESMECSECKDSQSNNKNMIKVDNNCFKIIQYDYDQVIFNISEMRPDNPLGNCSDFGKAIFYGQYECIDKSNNTYFVLNNISNTSVINNILDTTYNIICHKYCKSCNNSYNSSNNDMNCLECINDFYFIYGEKNCYNYSLLPNNKYYFNSTDSMFHECYYTCSECLNVEPNKTTHNCIKCAENYYKLENEFYPFNCYDNETINNLLNLKESSINTFELIKKSELFLLTDIIFSSECDISCMTCNIEISNNNCKECNIEKGYYPIQDSNSTCYNNETILEGYYLDIYNNPYTWKKCYSKCKTCESQGNDINMNCLSCQTSSNSNVKLTDGNCIYECLNIEFIAPNGSCVLSCPNGTSHFYQIGHALNHVLIIMK